MCEARKNYSDRVLLSVVIIARNEEKNTDACIQSVLEAAKPMQSEILFVDSRSDDRTLDIARAYPITTLRLQDGLPTNAASARHLGFLSSTGKYIQFLDGDMIIDKDWIYRAVSFLESTNNQIRAVSGHIAHEAMDNPLDQRFKKRLDMFTKTGQFREMRSLYGCFLISRGCLQEVGSFNPLLKYCEEGELSDRMYAKSCRIALLPCRCALHHSRGPLPFWQRLRKKLAFAFAEGQVMRLSLRSKDGFIYRMRQYWKRVVAAVLVPLCMAAVLTLGPFSHTVPIAVCLLPLIALVILSCIRGKFQPYYIVYFTLFYLVCWLCFMTGFAYGLRHHQPQCQGVTQRRK